MHGRAEEIGQDRDTSSWLRRIWPRLMLLLLLPPLTLTWCSGAPLALTGKEIRGQVLDAQTGQPIAGAQVIYLYRASSLKGNVASSPPEICYHATGAVADAQGRFHIPAWEKPQHYALPNAEPIGWAYARGYKVGWFSAIKGTVSSFALFEHPNDVFRLPPSHAEGDQRLEELWHFIRRVCSYGGASQRNVYPALKSAYDEAKSIALTKEQKKRVTVFASMVASAGIASTADPASTPAYKTEQEIAQFVREHLGATEPPLNHVTRVKQSPTNRSASSAEVRSDAPP